MKKRTISTILLIAVGLMTAHAQSALGVKFGANLTSIQAKSLDDPDVPALLFGIQTGLIFQKNLTNKWAIQPELLYIRKGYEAFEQTAALNTFIFDGDIKLDYLEIDLNAKYFLVAKNDVDWYLLAGPYFAYALDGRFEGEQGFPGLTSPFELNLYEEGNGLETVNFGTNNRFDMGFNVGFGGQFDLGKVWFFAEARYSQGILNLNGDSSASARNYGIYATFGWFVYLQGDK